MINKSILFLRGRCCVLSVAIVILCITRAHAQTATPTPALTLQGLLDSVRQGHPTIRAAESRVRAAEGARTTARTVGNPVLAYEVDQTPFPGGRPLPDMEREATTTATFPLEFLYQRGPAVARANADVRAAEADAAWERQQLGLDAAAAYYRLELAQVQSSTTHDLLAWLDTLVVYNRHRVREGVAAEVDLMRSELERDRVAAEAALGDAELARARTALGAFLAGLPGSGTAIVVATDVSPLPLLAARAIGPAGPTADAVSGSRRADVLAARERVAASAAALTSERRMILRQLGATIGTMQSGGTTSMVAGLSIPLPIFDQNRGEMQRANAERDAARFELAARERTAAADLAGAYQAARVLTERAAALSQDDSTGLLARADASRRIALGTYREGAVPLFQVIDAARSWADARMTYYRTLVAQHQSVLALIVAQGLDIFTAVPTSTSRGGTLR